MGDHYKRKTHKGVIPQKLRDNDKELKIEQEEEEQICIVTHSCTTPTKVLKKKRDEYEQINIRKLTYMHNEQVDLPERSNVNIVEERTECLGVEE